MWVHMMPTAKAALITNNTYLMELLVNVYVQASCDGVMCVLLLCTYKLAFVKSSHIYVYNELKYLNLFKAFLAMNE